ncbi:MAG: iron ABC transporter permease [Corallococcus sp.]|nr:iron ABC transporter permease [Corallococcus sp.]
MVNIGKPNMRKFGNNLKSYFSKPANIITIVFLIILGVTVVYPLISLVIGSVKVHVGEVNDIGQPYWSWTGYHWKETLNSDLKNFSKNFFWKPLGWSMLTSIIACVVAVALGGAVAWFITRSNLPCKKVISTIFVIPYVMPSWSIAMFWENFFKNTELKAGLSQVGMLQRITGICAPQWLVYGWFPVAMCLGIHYAPFAYILIGGILRNMDANLEEAATVLKTSRAKILWKITLPIVAPALISTVLLVFASSMSSYTVPTYLNADSSLNSKNIAIAMKGALGTTYDVGKGNVMAILLMVISIAIMMFNNWFTGKRKSFTTVTGKSGQVSLVNLGKAKIPLAIILIIITLFIAIVPLVSFALESFCPNGQWTLYYWTTTDSLASRVPNGDSRGIFHNAEIWKAYGYSIGLSLVVAFIAGTCGILIGYAVARKRGSKLATWMSNLAFVPYLIPALCFGAVYLAVKSSTTIFESQFGTFLLLMIVGGVKFMPFASRSGTNAMMQLSGEIEEAAIMMGVPWWKRMTRVLFPIQKSSFMSGYLLPFISCMREMTLFVLLISNGTILTIVLQDWNTFGESAAVPIANGINLIIIFTILLFQFIINKLTGASLDKGIGGN